MNTTLHVQHLDVKDLKIFVQFQKNIKMIMGRILKKPVVMIKNVGAIKNVLHSIVLLLNVIKNIAPLIY